jgi:hemerythrin superfamily protein
VSALLNRVKRSSDVDVRRRLFPTIRAELLAHEQGELREVYPVFRQHGELAAIADHHEKEAGELERLLDRIAALEFTDAAWSRLFDELVQMVTHHTREEENDYFPKASRILGKDESQRILPRYEAAKAAAGRPSITH